MQKTPDGMSRYAFERELEVSVLEGCMMPGFKDALGKRSVLFHRDLTGFNDTLRGVTRTGGSDGILERLCK